MSFIYPVLLGGLVLAGIPILLHLIMRQKPKHLFFPAFRFLVQRHRTNQRKLRLRHLLLLAMRLLLIACICLALTRPKVFSERLNLGSERPVAAVLIFDTSYSMEYTAAGQSRLDVAKHRARELIEELPEGSQIALLDTGEPGGEWLPNPSIAMDRIADLKLRPANGPVTNRIAEAYRLLSDLDQVPDPEEAGLPRFLYIFSDRTQESWDASRLKDLQQARDRLAKEVHAVFVDVGADNPADVAIVKAIPKRQVVPVNGKAILDVTVAATGQDCDTEVLCRFDGQKNAERKQVKLAAGQSQTLPFERQGLAPGPHQAEITLATTDALEFTNARFVTFEVRGGRRVLAIVDDPQDALLWKWALELPGGFQVTVNTPTELTKLGLRDLAPYQAICLVNVRKPDQYLWDKLEAYVKQGGGLAVVPAGGDLDLKSYNEETHAQRLLPGTLVKVDQAKDKNGAVWEAATYQHPIMAPFKEWGTSLDVDFIKFPRAAKKFWEVTPHATGTYIVVSYKGENRPALLETMFERKETRGRVLLFTTPLDTRNLQDDSWNDYLKNSFYMVLVNKTVGYLAGDAEEANFNYNSGQGIAVTLPASAPTPTYTLQGPGLSASESVITRAANQNEFSLAQARTPGNYTLVDGDGKHIASFSVNIPPDECQLARVPNEPIEALLGANSILAVGMSTNLHQALQGHWSQPVELFPWLMIAVLFLLAVENLLANKFYRQESRDEESPSGEVPIVAEDSAAVVQ